MLIKYVRTPRKIVFCPKTGKPRYIGGDKVGVVVATGSGQLGWSKCHKDDRWDKEVALSLAIARALKPIKVEKVPKDVFAELAYMAERADKFYNKK